MKNKVLGDLKFFLFLCFWQRGRPANSPRKKGWEKFKPKQNKTDPQSGQNVYKVASQFIYIYKSLDLFLKFLCNLLLNRRSIKNQMRIQKGFGPHCDFNKVKSRERNLACLNQNI